MSQSRSADDLDKRNPKRELPGLDEIVLTPEEEALLDPEFLRESVANAIAAVRKVESQRTARIRKLLAMRDLLFAQWVKKLAPSDLAQWDSSFEDELAELDVPTPDFHPEGEIELPRKALIYERVNRYVEDDHDLEVQDYVRIVHSIDQNDARISEKTTDEQLRSMFDSRTVVSRSRSPSKGNLRRAGGT
jgi:hypothetical protein